MPDDERDHRPDAPALDDRREEFLAWIEEHGDRVEVSEQFYRDFLAWTDQDPGALLGLCIADAANPHRKNPIKNDGTVEGLVAHVLQTAELFAYGWGCFDGQRERVLLRRAVGPKPLPATEALLRARIRTLGEHARRVLTAATTRN